ncbi:glycoside hydrolase family 127 protein [Opitutus sp. ER46]|uniref:glycoside hydrolase family 127 protein n=1 Tax=Opitutus sp. ER46 TaxID=2161864 RepID=UPI000D306409|nr:glycoside hydrolase family 127 protein [Opitutus sp. ER46]PTX97854.1 six-hairpin glycosidase [Opitutus sp. ER46]
MRSPLGLAMFVLGVAAVSAADYPVQPVPFTEVRLTGGFWQQRQEVNRTVTVPFALQQCEESGRLRNFDLAAETMRRRAAGEKTFQHQPPTIYPFDDTDVYKAIEGAAYVLSMQRDAALEAKLDAWIARVGAAQEPDGYLYTFRTMHPDSPGHKWVGAQRWEKDPELSHELYNCGHMYEAAVAYFQATGKRTFLDIALKNAELLWRDFGDRQRRIAPGHQIVEMGLVKLYRVTGDARWLTLAQIFLEARGPTGPEYNQRHLPVVDQTTAVGHAVRANYMYAGMADVAALTGDQRYLKAITKIWENVVTRKLYLTGGAGALAKGEAYGADYELPHDGYNETCATLALMMWNHRMFLLTGDARYMDVFERAAHNGFISGVSLSGDRFFYPNPLEYDGEKQNNHGHAGRAPWFGCACCPPNLMRTLASLTGSFYATRGAELFVNVYAASEGTATVAGTKVTLTQATDYPWNGAVKLTVAPETPATFTLRLRVPGWAQGQPQPSDLYVYADTQPAPTWTVRVAGAPVKPELQNGYVTVSREWRAGDVVELNFPMPVHRVRGHEKIAATQGRVAFERGPIVYCVEDVDRAHPLEALVVPATVTMAPESRPKLLGGVTVLTLDGATQQGHPVGPLTAIPYFAWNNRGLAPMAVWLRTAADPR